MAVALHFCKIAEQDTTVTYKYGPNPEQTPHLMVLDLVAETVRAADGTWGDPDLSRVAGKVLRLYRETGTWPEKGDYFS